MKDIHLAGKKILFEKSPVVFSYKPDGSWRDYVTPKSGNWYYEDGAIIGFEPKNKGGIAFVNKYFDKDVMLIFKASTVLPATRDLNAVWAAHWDDEKNYLGVSYVCGLNGWWENKAGIEKNLASNIFACTNSYKYIGGTEITMVCGSVNGHCFMTVDGELVSELVDPDPISGGYVGFSAYCTKLRITEIEVREIVSEPFRQSYVPEFPIDQ